MGKKVMSFIKDIVPTFAFMAILFSFVIVNARVPSGSMIPTIDIGDRLIANRITSHYREPQNGEIVVFNFGKEKFIKRVIASPEDVIDITEDGKVFINNQQLDESDYIRVIESTYPKSSIVYPYTVPSGKYFVMGDNRLESRDSREFGPIEDKDIIAIGGFKYFPITDIGIMK